MSERKQGDGGNSTSSATLSGPLTPEQTQQLIEQNAQLRNRLKEFNLALDRALRSSQSNVAASAKSAGNARIYQAVQDQELANVHKRMDILRKENEALKAERQKIPNLDRVAQLENELKAAQAAEKQAKDEVKTLTLELKRARKVLGDAPEALSVLQARENLIEDKIRKYKEQLKVYRTRHDQDQRFMRTQQTTMVDLESALRGAKGTFAPLALQPIPPPIPEMDVDADDSSSASGAAGAGDDAAASSSSTSSASSPASGSKSFRSKSPPRAASKA